MIRAKEAELRRRLHRVRRELGVLDHHAGVVEPARAQASTSRWSTRKPRQPETGGATSSLRLFACFKAAADRSPEPAASSIVAQVPFPIQAATISDNEIGPEIALRTAPGLTSSEDLIHDFGACRDHRSQFPAVHNLGCPGGSVSDQPGDFFDAYPAVAHQAHERGPELAWCPAIADPRRIAYAFEHLPDVPRVERGAEMGREHQPTVLPPSPGQQPFVSLTLQQRMECLDRHLGKAKRPA